MKKYYVIVLLLLCSMWRVSAQITYSVQSIPYSLSPVGATTATLWDDDIYTSAIALPFTFQYFGVGYSAIVIGTNGVVSFNLARANTTNAWTIPSNLINNTELVNSIAGVYHDMDLGVSGSIRYGSLGAAPNRRFVISWVNVPMFSCTSMLASSQVVLYEGSNIIDINITNKPLCTLWNGGAAIVGIKSPLGLGYTASNYDYPTQWTATQESWRFCPSSNCSVSPSYIIQGRAYRDNNLNCQQDNNEAGIPNLIIGTNNMFYTTSTDANGDYTLIVDSGTYVISQNNTALYNVRNCGGGTTHTVMIGGTLDTVSHVDFANLYIPPCSDKYVDIAINTLPRCSQTLVSLIYGNYGLSSDTNIVVHFHLPDSISLVSSTHSLNSLGNGNYSYAHNGVLLPSALIIIGLTLDIGCDTVGTNYCINTAISGARLDCSTLNNTLVECRQLSAATSPNSLVTIPSSSLDISVYPNPFSTSTLFHIGAYQNPLQFSLIDAMGRIVKTADINSANYTLNSDGLAKGIYFWRIIDQNGMPTTGRVVAQD